MTHVSIWSAKYKLKTKNHVLFSKNGINSSSIKKELTAQSSKKELTVQRNLLNNENTSSELRNNPTMPCNKFSDCQSSDENTILDMYNTSQDAKLISSPEKKEEYPCFTRNDTSPELFKLKNPFVKRVSDLTTSPSVLFNGNSRRRGRNLMRIRRTIIDENIIVESKYFSKQDDKKLNVLELENKRIEDVDLKNTKCNIIPETSDSICDTRTNHEPLEPLSTNYPEIINSVKDFDDALLSDQNEYLIDTCKDVSKKSYCNYSLTEVSHCKIDKDYILDKCLSSSSNIEVANDSINYENSLQNNLSECSSIKNHQTFLRKKKIFKKQSSINQVNIYLCKQVLLKSIEDSYFN